MKKKIPRILLTGADGFLGRHLRKVFEKRRFVDLVPVDRKDFNLIKESAVRRMMTQVRPDIVINAAAVVGGIAANTKYPGDLFYQNGMINMLVLEHCRRRGVQKVISFLCSCCYPADAPSPTKESMLWQGSPQHQNFAYSMAKNMALVQSRAYRQQYGLNAVVLVPGNMYGEYDHFDPERSHVAAALIRKFVEAKREKRPEVVLWGSGRARRDFVYAGDIARLIPFFLKHYDSPEPVNLSTGRAVSIAGLARTIRTLTAYPGRIVYDRSKPDGQLKKILDVRRMKALKLNCPTPLERGLKRTIAWYEKMGQINGVRRQQVNCLE